MGFNSAFKGLKVNQYFSTLYNFFCTFAAYLLSVFDVCNASCFMINSF